MTSVAGVCYGYQIESHLQFHYLRDGIGEGLVVTEHDGTWEASGGELLKDWPPRTHRPVHIKLHRTGEGFGLWISDAGWFSISSDRPEITVPPGGNALRREERLWGMPSILTFLSRGDLPLHAAGVEVGEIGVLFGGPSRHGKTTLAASLWDAGHRVLSEDLSCIDRNLKATPGPSMIRLRHDIAEALEFKNLETLAYDDDRAHTVMTGDLAVDPTPTPIGAVVLLDVGPELSVSRIDPTEAIPDLWLLTFHLPADDHETWLFQRVVDLASIVPVYRLSRPLEIGAISRTVEAIEDIASGVFVS